MLTSCSIQWVGEMEEIGTFVEEASSSSSSSPPNVSGTLPSASPRDMAAIYRGLTATFERVAHDFESQDDGGQDVAALKEWCAQGQSRLAR